MHHVDVMYIIVYVALLVACTPILGMYMKKVLCGEETLLHPALGWLERGIYRVCGITSGEGEMDWRAYTSALVLFNAIGLAVVFTVQCAQRVLPLNPNHCSGVEWMCALNTAISFVTNTNWQAYAGETTMSYLTQMCALTVQNFLSAATGIAVFCALTRGIVRTSTTYLGNCWVDIVRSVVYILVPLSVVFSLFLVAQGVVQTLQPNISVTTIEGKQQIIPRGPVASQVAIKQLGTNGGGFFNANSAHPFENPTPLTNFFELLAILLLPAGLVYTYGCMVQSKQHAWIIFGVMIGIWLAGLAVALYAEYDAHAVTHTASTSSYLEGKELRFGITPSVLWATATTAVSNGSVNAMHASLAPLAGGVALFNMMAGEILFGGIGSGMYGMIAFIILTVFLAGLMVGRTPEYLGKKIGKHEMQMVVLVVLVPCIMIFVTAGCACVIPSARASLSAQGPHGLSEILYACTSAAGNNGSAFAGLNANTPLYNTLTGIGMLVGRFGVIIPCLVLAGSLASKKSYAVSTGTFRIDSMMFALLLGAVICIVGVLTFFPALLLGPIAEHMCMLRGMMF